MNEAKSTRYHRLRRRADCVSGGIAILVLGLPAVTPGAVLLRDLAGGSAAACAAALALGYEALAAPVGWYRGVVLERQFGLSQVPGAGWLRDYVKSAALLVVAAAGAAEAALAFARWWPVAWWAVAAAAAALATGALTWLAPVLVGWVCRASRPLGRRSLRDRLDALSARAGIAGMDVREWASDGTARASAALAGAAGTRRILLSDTLLADFPDDEIEVILAHELGHQAHGDLLEQLAARFAMLLAGFFAADAVARGIGPHLGYAGPADPAALPLMALTLLATSLAARPFLNALSRRHERRADDFALRYASRPGAFISAMRRMADRNMAEERPSKGALWLFHGHPSVEERLERAERAARER